MQPANASAAASGELEPGPPGPAPLEEAALELPAFRCATPELAETPPQPLRSSAALASTTALRLILLGAITGNHGGSNLRIG
jgi:hypothetical protein